MNITHVIPYMHPDAGGPPVVVDRLCRRHAASGLTVRVLTTNALAGSKSGWEKDFDHDGYRLEVHKTVGRGAFAYSRTLAPAIIAAVAESDIVHLHTVWTYPTMKAARECQKRGVPYLVMPHGMLDPNSVRRKRVKKWLYAKWFEGPNLRRAAGLIYTHPEEERLARETVSGLPRGWIVPLAADEPPAVGRAELAGEFFSRHPDLIGCRIVSFLGRLHPKKGLDLLIPAFAELAGGRPDVRLILVGPCDPDYRRQLESLAVRFGIREQTKFIGSLAGREKWAALAAATVFVLPSYQENFAISVVEAMSVGTPVVISNRVNIWPEVEKSRAGVVFILESSKLSDRLIEVVANTEFAASLGNNGLRLVRESYSWDRTADAAENAYLGTLIASTHKNLHVLPSATLQGEPGVSSGEPGVHSGPGN